MRKYISMLISIAMLLGLAGCSQTTAPQKPSDEAQSINAQTADSLAPPPDTDDASGAQTAGASGEATDEGQATGTAADGQAITTTETEDDGQLSSSLTNENQSLSSASSAVSVTNLRPPGMEDLGIREQVPVYYLDAWIEASDTLNAAGQFLTPGGLEWETLTDIITGEEKYYTCTRYEYDGVDEYDRPQENCYSRLYDLDGNMISDWQPYMYSSGVGDTVKRYSYSEWGDDSDNSYSLWNPISNESAIGSKHYIELERLNDGAALCRCDDGLLGIIDVMGHIVSSPPDELQIEYAYAEHGYISTTVTIDGTVYRALLDESFNVIHLESDQFYYGSSSDVVRGNYVMAYNYDTPEYKFLNLSDLSTAASYGSHVEYFDGELAVAREEGYSWIENLDGSVVAGPYSLIYPLADTGRSEGFLVLDFEGGIAVVNRQGSVTSSLEGKTFVGNIEWYDYLYDGSEINNIHTAGGRIVYSIPAEGGDEWDSYYGLMDDRFNVLIPTDKHYEYINPLSTGKDSDSSLLIWKCQKYTWNYNSKYDLYDDEIRLIFEGAAKAGVLSNGLIPVARGFYYGLIDVEGNWVAKCSKFTANASD